MVDGRYWDAFISQVVLIIAALHASVMSCKMKKITTFEFFRIKADNVFQKLFRNTFIKLTYGCSNLWYEFIMNHSLVIEKYNQLYINT